MWGPTSQTVTWFELLETISFHEVKWQSVSLIFQPKNCQSRCHLLWQLWAILRFIGHFLCCPNAVTKSNLNIHILLKSSEELQSCAVKWYWYHEGLLDHQRRSSQCPAKVLTGDSILTLWSLCSVWLLSPLSCQWKYPGMLVEQNFTELIRQTTNQQHHHLLFKGWQNSWVWNGPCLYRVTEGNDPISWQAEVIVRLCTLQTCPGPGKIITNIPSFLRAPSAYRLFVFF